MEPIRIVRNCGAWHAACKRPNGRYRWNPLEEPQFIDTTACPTHRTPFHGGRVADDHTIVSVDELEIVVTQRAFKGIRFCSICLQYMEDVLKHEKKEANTVQPATPAPAQAQSGTVDLSKPVVVLSEKGQIRLTQATDGTIKAAKVLARQLAEANQNLTVTVMIPKVVYKRALPPVVEQKITVT